MYSQSAPTALRRLRQIFPIIPGVLSTELCDQRITEAWTRDVPLVKHPCRHLRDDPQNILHCVIPVLMCLFGVMRLLGVENLQTPPCKRQKHDAEPILARLLQRIPWPGTSGDETISAIPLTPVRLDGGPPTAPLLRICGSICDSRFLTNFGA